MDTFLCVLLTRENCTVHVAPCMHATSILDRVVSHTLSLTWHPLIASLPLLSSPSRWWVLPCCTATSPLFFFCLIEIQLGMQTMPISWHHILERDEYENIRLFPHICPSYSTDHRGPMPTGYFFYFYLILCLLSTHLTEISTNIRQAAFHLSEVTVNDWVSGFIVFASS